jgi:hypothetical protein
MSKITQRRERKTRFTLGRATLVAIALHVLFGSLVTVWPGLLQPPELMATPEEPPLQFNFVDTPETEPPPEPPDTNVLSDIDRQAADLAEPTPENTPFSEGNTVAQVIRPAAPPADESPESQAAEPAPEQPEPQPEESTEAAEELPDPTETVDDATLEAAPEEVAEAATETETAENVPVTPPAPRSRNLKRALARPEAFVDPQILDNPEGGAQGDRPIAQFDTKGYDLGAYLNEVLRKVETNWRDNMPPLIQTGVGGSTFVNLSIRRQRNAAGDEVAMIVAERTWTSGQPAYDSAAIFALELSNALPPIPGHYPYDAITGRLGFIYNLDPREVVYPEDR